MKHIQATGTVECSHCGNTLDYCNPQTGAVVTMTMMRHEEKCSENPAIRLLREIRDDMFERPEASLDDPPWMRKLDELLGA